VFTARYALSPYIKQIRFVFKGLKSIYGTVAHLSILWHYVQSEDGPFRPKHVVGNLLIHTHMPIPLAARSKAWVFGRSLCGFESQRGHGSPSLVSGVCCQVEVPATGWSLTQRSLTECGVSECDREVSTVRRPWPTRGLLRHCKNIYVYIK
jgi:hypothetical protein